MEDSLVVAEVFQKYLLRNNEPFLFYCRVPPYARWVASKQGENWANTSSGILWRASSTSNLENTQCNSKVFIHWFRLNWNFPDYILRLMVWYWIEALHISYLWWSELTFPLTAQMCLIWFDSLHPSSMHILLLAWEVDIVLKLIKSNRNLPESSLHLTVRIIPINWKRHKISFS